MAPSTLPKKDNLFSMLSKLFVTASVLMLISACGGQSYQLPQDGYAIPDPIAVPSPISAAQVFSNKAENWAFVNQYGEQTWIDIQPQHNGTTVWHYHKNADQAYWMPGVPADLWFYLSSDGTKWYSTGGHIIAPLGFPWDSTHTPQDFTYVTLSDPGMPRAYLILADSGTTVDTTFPDPAPGTHWKTSMYVENGELISEQWEGPCVHEKWHFAIGRGLVKVEPLDLGSCSPADPKLVMTRTN